MFRIILDKSRGLFYTVFMATLYRKYRSQSFADVIGQDPIVTTLTNQIKLGRIGHAYLFTGSRGIGKTSCARIFARAVNCLHPVNGSPCGECEVCKKLAVDNVDIIEMDAASNNGVDDARDIREKVKYLPVACKYKVYIIDEAHMLTGGAFNALLKTIEEPPDHVIFILATTEPQKLPQTILSRCIRFDFRLVPTDILAKHIARIYDAEGINYTPEAVEEIARLGDGSVRDALSVADTLASAAEVITADVVLSLTGAGETERIAELFDRTAARDLAGTLTAVDKFAAAGRSISAVCRQLIDYTRNVLVAKSVGRDKAAPMINASRAALDTIFAAADKYSMRDVSRMLEVLGATESGLKYSVNPRVFLETSLVKLVCGAQTEDDILRRLTALENSAGLPAEQKKNNQAAITPQSEPSQKQSNPKVEQSAPRENIAAGDARSDPDKPSDFDYPPPEASAIPSAMRDTAPPDDYLPPPEPEFIPPPPDIFSPTTPAARKRQPKAQISVSSADEGEFRHLSATAQDDGLELLGKISAALRKTGTPIAARVRGILSRGVLAKERDDAIAFVTPDDTFMAMNAPDVIVALNGVLDALGIKKRARIDRTEDDLREEDVKRARALFGFDCVYLAQ